MRHIFRCYSLADHLQLLIALGDLLFTVSYIVERVATPVEQVFHGNEHLTLEHTHTESSGKERPRDDGYLQPIQTLWLRQLP